MTGGLTLEGPGVLPALAVPRSAAEVADAVRDAAARGIRLRLVAGGTWLDAGHPVAADATLPLGALRSVVDYVPGDLTLTARAGTPLAELATVTRAEGQFVPLAPPGADAGTLGATVATASAGPLAHAFGLPRDLVLGVEFVTGAGDVVRAGGRVVKNVAGFDLVRLMTGAWGTLGALTEISVRLRALPEVDATVAVPLPPAARLADWLERLRTLPLAVWALELVNAPLAEQLGVAGAPAGGARAGGVLLARLAGNATLVAAQRGSLAALGDVAEAGADVWARLRAAEPRAAVVLRRAAPPTALAALCAEPFSPAAAAFGLLAHASVGRGVLRMILPGDTGFGLPSLDAPRGASGISAPQSLVVERLPVRLWPTLGARLAPGRARDPLSRRLRAAFDPAGILNPGILGEVGAGPAA